MTPELDRERILAALARLSDRLAEAGVKGEICLLGGTAMVLAFRARASTRDVDAIFEPAGIVRAAARKVGEEMNLPEHWLNDGAKGFASAFHDAVTGDLPQFANLRLTAPTAEYMLAMKCLAARLAGGAGEKGDEEDIRYLVRKLGITSASDALDIVTRYYPADRIPARTQFVLDDLFADLDNTP